MLEEVEVLDIEGLAEADYYVASTAFGPIADCMEAADIAVVVSELELVEEDVLLEV